MYSTIAMSVAISLYIGFSIHVTLYETDLRFLFFLSELVVEYLEQTPAFLSAFLLYSTVLGVSQQLSVCYCSIYNENKALWEPVVKVF